MADLKILHDLLEAADEALDKDTYEQFRRDEDMPDDAEVWLSAGTVHKITKLINEVYGLLNDAPSR